MANTLEVSPADDVTKVKDTELLRKFEVIQELSGDSSSVVNTFLDMVIRDFKTKQAHAQ